MSFIFIEGKDGWSLNGTPDISVSKTDNGFMLKLTLSMITECLSN